MSTFYGGEQLVNVSILSASGDLTNGVKYTCPAGRYAIVHILLINSANHAVNYTTAGVSRSIDIQIDSIGADGPNEPSFYLSAGDNIGQTGVSTYKYLIQEYLLP